ncbi:MAG: PAS domain S-box protein, partial [Chitinophagaceae bacterium]
DGIWDWNLAENSIFLSDTGKAIIGFLPEEYVCKPEDLSNRIHPDDFNLFNEAVQNHFTGKAATIFCEYRVKCKDGSFKWVQSKGKIVERNEQGVPLRVVGSHSDIHQRKLTETKLKQNEETLLNIFNFSPVPKLISKVNGGQIVMVNQSLLNISGYEEDELIGKDTMHFYASNEEKELVKDMFAKTGSVKNLELQLKSKNGTLHYCLVSSDVITMNNELMVISGFIDITHLKTLSKALHRSENNIKTILNNTNTGYVLLNTNLNIVTYNEKMYEMVKEDSGAELTIGANALPLFSVEKQPVVKNIFELVKQGQKITREFSQIYANNSTKWFIANFFPVHNNQSEIEAFVMSLEEITERKSVALELEKSFSLVSAQNQRLVNFSYIVSHNLRSHTSNIKSILHFLKLTTDETEKKELLFHLQAVTNSLDDTLYHLNEVVEIQNNVNITVSTIKLLPVIQKSMQLLQNQIALKGACIEVLVNGQITIQHNPAYIESIVLNFLSNAVKYHQPGRKPLVIIEALANKDGGIELSITDNGRGINLQKHGEKLFGMYKTFHDNKDARGIGLFITKNQIEALGGSVNVKSKPHVGTCFTIQFK